jgi:hypothetical protein
VLCLPLPFCRPTEPPGEFRALSVNYNVFGASYGVVCTDRPLAPFPLGPQTLSPMGRHRQARQGRQWRAPRRLLERCWLTARPLDGSHVDAPGGPSPSQLPKAYWLVERFPRTSGALWRPSVGPLKRVVGSLRKGYGALSHNQGRSIILFLEVAQRRQAKL